MRSEPRDIHFHIVILFSRKDPKKFSGTPDKQLRHYPSLCLWHVENTEQLLTITLAGHRAQGQLTFELLPRGWFWDSKTDPWTLGAGQGGSSHGRIWITKLYFDAFLCCFLFKHFLLSLHHLLFIINHSFFPQSLAAFLHHMLMSLLSSSIISCHLSSPSIIHSLVRLLPSLLVLWRRKC